APEPAATAGATASADQHVVVRLDPSATNADEHVVSAYLYEGGTATPLRPEKDSWANWTRKNRAALLGAIWHAARKHRASAQRLVFEFVVPLSLLFEKVDQWPMAVEGLVPVRIGDRCPVVLGLRNRVVHDEPHKSLKDRCTSVGAGLRQPCRLVDAAGAAPA